MTELKEAAITPEHIEEAFTYQEYRSHIDNLLEQQKTTGENHSEEMLHYTKMNVHRMKRLDKTVEISEEAAQAVERVQRPQIWLVLTEAWCGDAAQIIPMLQKMADLNSNITLKLILRDQHLDIMDQFLTNGKSRSIPKLVCLDADSLEILGDWGPRPELARLLYDDWKSSENEDYRAISERLHKWYADDKTRSSQQELASEIEQWEKR
jgi:hypothetical protein